LGYSVCVALVLVAGAAQGGDVSVSSSAETSVLFRDALRRHVDEFCAPEGAYPTCTGAALQAADDLGCGAGASPLRAALPAPLVSRGGADPDDRPCHGTSLPTGAAGAALPRSHTSHASRWPGAGRLLHRAVRLLALALYVAAALGVMCLAALGDNR